MASSIAGVTGSRVFPFHSILPPSWEAARAEKANEAAMVRSPRFMRACSARENSTDCSVSRLRADKGEDGGAGVGELQRGAEFRGGFPRHGLVAIGRAAARLP